MHNSRVKRISLVVCFALLPMAAGAAGLGKLTVMSGLGEPLNAEVELLSTSSEELASLSARIAPSELFAEQGIERSSSLSAVQVEVGKRPDGTPILRLSSPQPINDPFLDMLIQVEWSSGRLLREYTALLDPPGYGDQMATPVAVLPSVESVQTRSVPKSASEVVSAKTRQHKGAKVATGAAPADESGSHAVQKGETLQAIAKQTQVEGVSLEQMLVGLYRANEDAFAGSNMNRLKVGKIIHVPGKEELQTIGQPEAVKEIRVQTANWNAYRNKLAGMVAESAPAKEESSPQRAGGKITAPAEDKSVVPAPGPHDVVKLSKSETGGVASAGVAGSASRLSALQEEATAREKAIKEAGEHVATLEKQLQDMQKLLEIKNKSLADAQKTAMAPEPAKMEPAQPALPVVQSPKVEPAPPAPAPAAKQAPEPAKPEAKAAEKKQKKIVHPAPLQPKAEPGIFDALKENLPLLAGGGGLVALIGGVWFYLRNKRKRGLDSFEQGILTSGGLKTNTLFGNTAVGTADTGESSFLTGFGQGASPGMIDTSEVDPIAEAEVYMAYGRDVQAEEILKDAIAKEPKRHELHLKLLEIFASRKDSGAFETLAGELYATLGATDPTWAKVAELGRKFEPDNPLYAETASHAKAGAEPTGHDSAMMQQEAPVASSDEASGDIDTGPGGADSSLDFTLGEPAADTSQSAGNISAESNTLDFDVGGLESPVEMSSAEAAGERLPDIGLSPQEVNAEPASDVAAVAAEQETAGLDFQLDFPEPAVADNTRLDAADLGLEALPEMPQATTTGMPGDLGEVSLELPALDAVESVQPVAEAAEPSFPDMGSPFDQPAAMEEISLDMPKGESQAEAGSPDIDLTEPLEVPAASEAVPDIDQAAALELPAENAAESGEITPGSTDEAVEESGGLDFNFDIDLAKAARQAEAPPAAAAQLPDIDLSGISLEVDEGMAAAESGATREITSPSAESSDVDTKLDLVTAYVDMGDKDGARELLQEVLKEGGPGQREKAQKLLESLG